MLNFGRKTNAYHTERTKFGDPAEYRVKIKESETIEKFLDLAWELKKLWNMKVMVILIVVGTLGIIMKGLEKKLGEIGD